ncbi:MAG: endonuclease/exonuclease/phosphatase family protein [Acetobacteraceae bacterium]|nr:endonuclease/exonuclease/phosphatase family protein [Acetobacteraceae bacterium]
MTTLRHILRGLAWLILACLLPALAQAEELKVATWNLNWLTLRTQDAAHLPADVKPRAPEDFDRLAHYADQLNADVIAIQEVDGWDAAARLFPRDRYSIHMTRDHVVQRVGIVVRRGLRYDRNPDVVAIDANPAEHLRSGADLTLHLAAGDLRVLAVHLKTGCQDKPLARSTRRPCVQLREQIEPLQAWIADRQQEGVPFLVLGDFNRRMERPDQFIVALRKAAPLLRATEGRSSPCWGNEAFIDHILAGGAARDWIVPGSLRVMTYREQGPEWPDRLSDHCPVSVRLAIPDGLPAATASPSVASPTEAVQP